MWKPVESFTMDLMAYAGEPKTRARSRQMYAICLFYVAFMAVVTGLTYGSILSFVASGVFILGGVLCWLDARNTRAAMRDLDPNVTTLNQEKRAEDRTQSARQD